VSDRVHLYEYLTAAEVAQLLCKTRDRIYDYVERGVFEDMGWIVLYSARGGGGGRPKIWIGLPIVADPGPSSPRVERVEGQTESAASRAARCADAKKRSAEIMPVIEALRSNGASSLTAICNGLSERGILTVRGRKKWHPAQVQRIIDSSSW
jgi:hypothetical protein